jgi:FkbM family methyltransferase
MCPQRLMRQQQKVVLAGVVGRLNRPGLRPLLAVTASIGLSARNRNVSWVRYRHGRWEHHLGHTAAASPNMLVRGPADWEAAFAEQWVSTYRPKSGDCVVDVGAGIGTEVYPLARMVGPSGRVIAIEAMPAIAQCLQWTVNKNSLNIVTIHQVAASDAPGVIDISADLDAHEHNSVLANDLFLSPGHTQQVPADTLDSLLTEVEHVDWLKMNIEGAERQALVGASRLLDRTDHVVISCHDFIADAGGPPELNTTGIATQILQDHGFTISRRPDHRPWIRDQIWGDRT